MPVRDSAVEIDHEEHGDEDEDEDREPTQVTKLLADYDETIERSKECLDRSDDKAAALRRKLRGSKDTPSKTMRAIRDSIAPAPKRDG